MQSFVLILMGSSSDMEQSEAIAAALEKLEIACEMRIGSAHKTPQHVLDMLAEYEADLRPKVYITIAGRSNALSAFVDTQVSAPVIACPPVSSSFGGADIFSSLRLPSGVGPALVIEPSGAALLAGKILALADPALKERVVAMQQAYASKVINDDEQLRDSKT